MKKTPRPIQGGQGERAAAGLAILRRRHRRSCGSRFYCFCAAQVCPVHVRAKFFAAHHPASFAVYGNRQFLSAILAVDDIP